MPRSVYLEQYHRLGRLLERRGLTHWRMVYRRLYSQVRKYYPVQLSAMRRTAIILRED